MMVNINLLVLLSITNMADTNRYLFVYAEDGDDVTMEIKNEADIASTNEDTSRPPETIESISIKCHYLYQTCIETKDKENACEFLFAENSTQCLRYIKQIFVDICKSYKFNKTISVKKARVLKYNCKKVESIINLDGLGYEGINCVDGYVGCIGNIIPGIKCKKMFENCGYHKRMEVIDLCKTYKKKKEFSGERSEIMRDYCNIYLHSDSVFEILGEIENEKKKCSQFMSDCKKAGRFFNQCFEFFSKCKHYTTSLIFELCATYKTDTRETSKKKQFIETNCAKLT